MAEDPYAEDPYATYAAGQYDQPLVEGLKQGLLANALGPRLRLLHNLLTARVDEETGPIGLRSGTYWVMALIDANPGCSQADIARGVATDKANLVALLGELEKRGLAVRVRSSSDRRRNALSLTEEGKAVMREMGAAIARAGKPMRDAFTPEEFAILRSFVLRAYVALQSHDPNEPGRTD
jgi:DNA-binding MarR family transcriptional regulator